MGSFARRQNRTSKKNWNGAKKHNYRFHYEHKCVSHCFCTFCTSYKEEEDTALHLLEYMPCNMSVRRSYFGAYCTKDVEYWSRINIVSLSHLIASPESLHGQEITENCSITMDTMCSKGVQPTSLSGHTFVPTLLVRVGA